jgi:acetylornithine deacetylase
VAELAQAAKEKVFELIQSRRNEVVGFLSELIRHPSTNCDFKGYAEATEEKECMEWLKGQLNSFGVFRPADFWEVEKNRPNMVSVLAGTDPKAGRSLSFLGHVDVVPVTPDQRAVWDGDPYSGAIKDGKVFGRGANDMKGGVVAMIMAAKLLAEAGVKLNGEIDLAFVIGEESGRHEIGCDTVFERGYRTDFAINPEPTGQEIYPIVKGEIYFKIGVKGKAAHISARNKCILPLPYGQKHPGVSAIEKMMKIQQAILGLEQDWMLYQEHPMVPQGESFININQIWGGEAFSSIPETCYCTGSLYFQPGRTAAQVTKELRDLLDSVAKTDYWLRENPPELEVPWQGLLKEAGEVPADHPGCLTLSSVFRALNGVAPMVRFAPFVGDANFWTPMGQPTVVYGPGDLTMGAHGANEYLPVADLMAVTKVLAAFMVDWCGVARID